METHSTAARPSTSSQAFRAISTAVCAGLFAIMLAFGAPTDSASADVNIDAHSEIGFEVALDADVSNDG